MYNYLENIKDDVKDVIFDYVTKEELKEALEDLDAKNDLCSKLYDDLFVDDTVTGNGSGSYTFNTYQAEENLCHNLDLLKDAFDEFGVSYSEVLERGAEYCDVTIRCYLLGTAIKEALDELKEELQSD